MIIGEPTNPIAIKIVRHKQLQIRIAIDQGVIDHCVIACLDVLISMSKSQVWGPVEVTLPEW
ncbi:MAG TPA: hypothetical protein VFN35_05875 [Ktedonobacteraceae bacterium]|nr:hypothetical protein [Ktedonobacteraceae bacterium]